jgi:hypothetical protein
VTITGENFSPYEATDNPVKIGDHYCYVLTTSETQITCQLDYLPMQRAKNETLIVFLKTSEEAQVLDSSLKSFTFVTPNANVTDISTSFVDGKNIVNVTGTGFDQSTQLLLDDIPQL